MKHYSQFCAGLKAGTPIAIGYFAVSFSFGMLAAAAGLSILDAGLISITNLTSAGQFAGLSVITSGASLLEMALTQLIINARYMLMSLSLSQKLDPSISTFKRALIAFANTDEIFAVAMSNSEPLSASYMFGLASLPIIGWTSGTIIGAASRGLLPTSIQSALGLALYAMFIAVIIPTAKAIKPVRIVVLLSVVVSCLFYYLPILRDISKGFAIVLCTLIAAGLGAILFPIPDEEEL